jgi:hypothetical protein
VSVVVSDGGYVMVNCAKLPGTSYALDTKGATNSKGANVRLYTLNSSDAQLVTLQTYDSTNDYQVIRFPLTGMVLDVQGGRVAQGQNVQQYPWNKGKGQQWLIGSAGSSYTINGQTYTSYKVKSALNTGYELEAFGTPSAVTSGTNLDIAATTSELDHYWCFVPAPILQHGRAYKLLSAADQRVAVGLSGKDGDNQVQLVGETDSNDQRWLITNDYPTVTISPLSNTNVVMAPKGYAAANSVPILVQKDNNDQSCNWYPTIVASQSLNGQQTPLTQIRCKEGVNLVMDVKGGGAAVGTNLIVFGSHGGKNQQFLAIPETALDTSLPAGSKLGIADSIGGAAKNTIAGTGKVNVYPSWIGNATNWELRYRWRYRKASSSQSDWSGWSCWRNISNANVAERGWGTGKSATCVPTKSRDAVGAMRNYAKAIPYTLSATNQDAIELQWEVRQWAAKTSASKVERHGNVATATSRLYYRPTLTVSAAYWSYKGLRLAYSADQPRGGNKLTVTRITTVVNGKTVVIYEGSGIVLEGLKSSGSVTIPQEQIDCLLMAGDPISIRAKWTNADGISRTTTYSGTIAYDSGATMTINAPTIVQPSAANGWMLQVNASNTTADGIVLYIDYGDARKDVVRYADNGDRKWAVPMRYGVAYSVYLLGRNGSLWKLYKATTLPAVADPRLYVFNFQDIEGAWDWFVIRVAAGSPPKFTRSYEADYDAQMTNGAALEVVHFSQAQRGGGTVTGDYVPALATKHGDMASASRLMDAHYAWLRASDGEVYRVAITSMEYDQQPEKHDGISVTFRLTNSPMVY